jgi:hypothetical protein
LRVRAPALAPLLPDDRERAVDLDDVIACALSAPARQDEVTVATAARIRNFHFGTAPGAGDCTQRHVDHDTRSLDVRTVSHATKRTDLGDFSPHRSTSRALYSRHGDDSDLRQRHLTLYVERPGGVRAKGFHRRLHQHPQGPGAAARDARALGRTARGAGARRRRGQGDDRLRGNVRRLTADRASATREQQRRSDERAYDLAIDPASVNT